MKYMHFFALLLLFFSLQGCSDGTTNSTRLDATNKHPSGWLTIHGSEYRSSQSSCQGCHGSDLQGGISGVSCFSCHPGGPHLGAYPGARHRADIDMMIFGSNSFIATCGRCHDLETVGSSYPAAGGALPNCSGCHTRGLFASPGQNGCADCHGFVNSDGLTGRPDGGSFPNSSGQHFGPSHLVACQACHAGGGTGALSHGSSGGIVKGFGDVTIGFADISGVHITAVDSATPVAYRRPGAVSVTCTLSCHNSYTNSSHSHNSSTW